VTIVAIVLIDAGRQTAGDAEGSVSIVRRSDSPTAYSSLSTGKCIQQHSRDRNPPPKIAIIITTEITICFVAYPLPSTKISRNPFRIFFLC